MGSGGSKQEQHVFNADAPVRFSQSVVDSLQDSSDTDSTRAQDVELKIQSRVNSELKRLREEQAQKLTALTDSLNTDSSQEGSASSQKGQGDSNSLLSHLSKKGSADSKQESNRSHDSVQKEIMDLRQKLDSRKKLEKASPELDKAKESLVKCLRTNDRRPLDCWQEVENFKAEVGKLEHAFIQKAGR